MNCAQVKSKVTSLSVTLSAWSLNSCHCHQGLHYWQCTQALHSSAGRADAVMGPSVFSTDLAELFWKNFVRCDQRNYLLIWPSLSFSKQSGGEQTHPPELTYNTVFKKHCCKGTCCCVTRVTALFSLSNWFNGIHKSKIVVYVQEVHVY